MKLPQDRKPLCWFVNLQTPLKLLEEVHLNWVLTMFQTFDFRISVFQVHVVARSASSA